MKQCTMCNRIKPIAWFYKKKGQRESQCKGCRNIYFNEYGRKNILKRRFWVRKSQARPKYKIRVRILSQAWRDKNRDKLKEYREKWAFKHKTRQATRQAIKKGILKRQPCEVCGKKSEAHHPDYSKPLKIKWLCRKHHGVIHRKKD